MPTSCRSVRTSFCGRVRLAQPGHVFDGQHVRAHALQFARHLHVIIERILVAARIQDVARVTDRGLADLAGLAHGLHGDLHVRKPVQRVEDAENIDALRGGLADESLDSIVRISGIAYGVRRTQQHLETNVRNGFAQLAQPQPRIFVQEAHGHVEGRPAPHLQAVEVVQPVRHEVGDAQHVIGTHARGQQRLMRVAECGVGEQQPLLRKRVHSANFSRPHGVEQLTGTVRRRGGVARRHVAERRCARGPACRPLSDSGLRSLRPGTSAAWWRGPGAARSGTTPASAPAIPWSRGRPGNRGGSPRFPGTGYWSSRRARGTRAGRGPCAGRRAGSSRPQAVVFTSSES